MKKFKAIDLFCGAGGLSSGLCSAGFDVKLALDINDKALQTYTYNFPNTKTINEDIKSVTGDMILKKAKIKRGENFLLAGCPPCQGFSNIGKRDVSDEKNQLVFEYVRIIMETDPSFILMENVPGMSRGVGKEIFKEVIKLLSAKYVLNYDMLNAADYGVPQMRKRLVVHGIRNDVYNTLEQKRIQMMNKLLPQKTHSNNPDTSSQEKWVTVGEVLAGLPTISAGETYSGDGVYNHTARKLSELNSRRLDYIRKNGGSRNCLTDDLVLNCHKRNKVFYGDTYGVMDINKPSPTLTSGCTSITKGRFGHPIQNRGISIREAARLQSFDDNFKFIGNLHDMSLQIGNAVPPKLAEASGRSIKELMIKYKKILDGEI